MLVQQRHQIILDKLNKTGIVHTVDLVTQMSVSSETIRKDLDSLEKAGYLKRVHGGAVLSKEKPSASPQSNEYISLQIRNSQHMEQKYAIAEQAASIVREGQIVALDYGSTSQIMSMALKQKFHALTVITNSIQNALILSECPGFTIILTGGILNKEEYTLGNDFSPLLEHLHVDILFMTVTGIDPVIGCTDQCFSEARIQNQMRECASRTVVLADSSKFGKGSLVKVCSIKDIDLIITDSGISPDMEQAILKTGTELVIVGR